MNELLLRKKTLVLESDLNRLRLHAECARLREATNWLGRFREAKSLGTSLPLLLAPLAGLTLALGLRRRTSGGAWLTRILAVAPSLIQLWSQAMARKNNSNQKPGSSGH